MSSKVNLACTCKQHMMIPVDVSCLVEDMLNSVKSAQSCSSISSLDLQCGHNANPVAVTAGLIHLCCGLHHLTHLKIDFTHSKNTFILLVNIVQKLTMLRSLEFSELYMDETPEEVMYVGEATEQTANEYDDLFYSKISTINSSNIKSLRLTTYSCGVSGTQEGLLTKLNSLFNFIILSCPILERFDVYLGDIYASGRIDLDFRRLPNLKQSKIDQGNCRYYTFQHDGSGRYWANVDVPISQEELTWNQEEEPSYHINLAWHTSKYTDVQLSNSNW